MMWLNALIEVYVVVYKKFPHMMWCLIVVFWEFGRPRGRRPPRSPQAARSR